MPQLAAVTTDEESMAAPEAATPQVLVRTFVTPAGLPWEQTRAAQLEARHGAPLPITDLVHRLKRLEAWAPGRSGRFAVFYVRRRDYKAPFEASVDVDGEAVRVAFGRGVDQLRHVRRAGLAVVVAVAFAVTTAWAVGLVLASRGEAEQQLGRLERQAAAKLRAAHRIQAGDDLSRRLLRAQGASGRVDDVLADFTWVARAKQPEARIVALHWDHGLVALEARGDAAPVAAAEHKIVRSPKPIRPGVWLWGVSPDGSPPARPASEAIGP